MHPSTTLTSKNQMTLPRQVREDLGLKPGDRLVFRKSDGNYVLEARKRRSALEFAGGRPLIQESRTARTRFASSAGWS